LKKPLKNGGPTISGPTVSKFNMTLMTDDRLSAARFVADVWHNERKCRRRRPAPHEVVIASYAAATEILDAFVGSNQFRYLGAPREARTCLYALTGGGTKVPSRLADQAEVTLKYLDQAGDLLTARAESKDADRRIMQAMASTYFRRRAGRTIRDVNDSEIGRSVGLSHTSVRDRRLARSARIMAALHRDFPDLWRKNGRPVAEQASTAAPLRLAA
jgi:hypothetical protein